jgi:FixJ family two-component response regulator
MNPEDGKLDPVVCIVDDDESVRKALSRLVESLGMRAEAFASPADFLSRAVEERIACVLLDIQLPGMDGFELHDRSVEAGLDSPVIFITAHPDDRTRARAKKADAVAYLEKPFDDQTLLDAIEDALDRVASGEGHRGPR